MGFEYIYAYLENTYWFFIMGLIALSAFMVFLIIARKNNDIDRDDWVYMIGANGIAWFVFLLICLSPGMDHIQKVRTEVMKPYIEKTEITIEKILQSHYPNGTCHSSVDCLKK
jgi:hypothetical protein